MTVMTSKAIRRASLAAMNNADRARSINALKMVQEMTAAPDSLAEARALAEIAAYWSETENRVKWPR